jgi:hypothetical protein
MNYNLRPIRDRQLKFWSQLPQDILLTIYFLASRNPKLGWRRGKTGLRLVRTY